MKTKLTFALITLASLAGIYTARGQNVVLTYQGRVASGGTSFTGTGQFKFALVTSTNTSRTATATANPPSGGFITIINVIDGGSGYVSAPAVTISGGGGSGVTATATVSGGAVTSITVNNPGSGHTSTPTVTVAAPPATIVYTTYWSNDGTSSAGSEPAAAVNVNVANGLFTAGLGDTTLVNMAALGAGLFSRPDLQLRIWFNDGVSGFGLLSPVQNLTFAPYAAFAHSASNLLGTLAAGQLSGPYTGAVSFNNPANVFSGSGAGLTGLNASQLSSGTVPDSRLDANIARTSQVWLLSGNAGTASGANFLGTSDNQALELRVNNQRALRLEPQGSQSPNLLGGYAGNFIGAGYFGSVVGGGGALGNSNSIHASYGVITGGRANDVGRNSDGSAIGGGLDNNIGSNSFYATIAGGFGNNIADRSFGPIIAGGVANDIGANSDFSAIGGGRENYVADNSFGAAVAGGAFNDIGTNSHYSAIGGGNSNSIHASYGVIAGGALNDIGTNSHYSAIGGGGHNYIWSNSFYSTIAGGAFNNIGLNSDYSAIGGGDGNIIQHNSESATIAGGSVNAIESDSDYSAIGGGFENTIADNSFGATIAGGRFNDIGRDSGDSAIGGGVDHNVAANAQYATIPGGVGNFATNLAFAAGYSAHAIHSGAFVWSDGGGTLTTSAAPNTVTMRARGGFRFLTGAGTGGAELLAGATSWGMISDRNAKKNFTPVDTREVLDKLAGLPVQQWNYKWESDDSVPHVGPVAQDFKAAFYPGRDDKTITTQEMDGVALAAIQGLNQKLEEQLQAKEAKISLLERRLAQLEKLMLKSSQAK